MNALAKPLFLEPDYDRSRNSFEHIVGYLDFEEACLMTHSDLERELEKKGRELMRVMLQDHLRARGPGQCEQPVCGADGVERSRLRVHERKLETVFGTVSVKRVGYGQQAAESLHPLDAELNLPDEWYSLELRRRVAEEAAKSSFDETLESIGKSTGAHVAKRQIEELVMRAAQDFDAFYQMRQGQPTAGDQTGLIMVISVDGKGVVMRQEDLREQTRKAAIKREHKMGARLSKGEKKNAKCMATVATVYTIAPFVRRPGNLVAGNNIARAGPPRFRPEQKCIWASLKKSPKEVIEEAFKEADYRDSIRKKKWVAIVDGNKGQLRILRRMAKDKDLDLTIIVDIIHVIEYLWDAGRAFYPEAGSELESWVQNRLIEVLRGRAGYVAGGMRRSATRRGLLSAQ